MDGLAPPSSPGPRTMVLRLFAALAILSAWACLAAAAADMVLPGWLFSEEEAGRLRLTPQEWATPRIPSRSLGAGPIIELERPSPAQTPQGQVIETGPRLSLLVRFKDRAAPVAMDTLRVRGRKGVFSLSLTERLLPYLRGRTLEAQDLAVPEGRFELEVSVADSEGRTTVETYLIRVSP